jgi:hypothetical protein
MPSQLKSAVALLVPQLKRKIEKSTRLIFLSPLLSGLPQPYGKSLPIKKLSDLPKPDLLVVESINDTFAV